jgi:ferritin-like metal-binding protein YciE
MKGLVKEGSEVMAEDFDDAVLDAGLIGAARRVEHYEMAAYAAVYEFAMVLGQNRQASLLEKTLAEEKQTDDKFAELAKEINAQANEEGLEDEQGAPKSAHKTPKRAA